MIRRFSILLTLVSTAIAQTPAFPGAEGFGAYANGGRGGDVYVVTNLNTSGAGSFYEGITTVPTTGRTVVFAVSGQIHLAGGVATRITANKLTIAGQTAPGDGILLKDGTLRISGDDIVIRHLRFRHGKNGSGGDCIDLDSGCQNAILDHISMSFSTDENISSFGSPPENLTLQWSLNSWGLESHSCGGLWDQNHATCHHTLWAHNHTRNPKARPNALLEWTNNTTFDWDIGFIMGDSQTPAAWKANVRGNYFICPPGNIRNTPLEKASLDRNGYPNFSVYQDNNLHDRDGDGILNGTDRGWSIVSGSAYDATTNPAGNYLKLTSPVAGSALLNVDAPLLGYKKLVSNSGALRPDYKYTGALRDEVDTRMIQNLTAQTRNHITRESDLAGVSNGGFGTFSPSTPPIDSDKDGMPDPFEIALGWNPGVKDHTTAVSGTAFFPAGYPSSYTRLEEYLHFKSVPHLMLLKNTSTSPDIDLTRYAAGFSSNPVFTLTNITGGTATQSGTGGKLVHFTANNTAGRGGFTFTVTDSAGSVWSQQFAICITNSGDPVDLKWRGTGAAWDTSSQNWLNNGAPSLFSSGDRVTFDSTGAAAPNVTVAGAVTATTIDFNASGNFTLSGAGGVSATNHLTKRGTGSLSIANTGANSFTGIDLQEGSLALNTSTAGGSAKVSFNGGALSLAPASNAVIACPLEFNEATTITVGSQHTQSGNWTGTQNVTVNATSGQLWTIAGTWTGFTGRMSAGTGNPRFRINGNSNTNFGSAQVAVDLGSGSAQLMNRNGATIEIGELSSTGGSTVLSGTQTGTTASTYNIGGKNTNATFAGVISNGGGTTHITKTGSGSWTLTGASTHTGTTTVSTGSLFLGGSFVSSPVSVSSGALLGGAGSVGGLVTVSGGGTIAPGSSGQAGIFTAANGLALSGNVEVNLDLSNSSAGSNDKIDVSAGTLTLSGTTLDFNVRMIDGQLGTGTYNLIAGNATMAANPAPAINLIGVPSGTRQTLSLQRQSNGVSPAFVNLVVGGTNPASLLWSGTSGGGLWDYNTTGNFTGGPTATFYNLDAVTFNDTSTVGNVLLSGILMPATVTVSNSSRAYTFSGNGLLAGSGSLVKSGSGTLTITPSIVSVSTTTTSGTNSATVTDAAGLAIGMAVNGGGFAYGTTITGISGTTITFSANSASSATATLIYHTRNTISGGTFISGGTVQLGNEAANRWGLGSGAVTFHGGTLKLYDFGANLPGAGDFPNDLVVSTGQSGTLHTPQRGSLSGDLTGGGTLHVVVKYVRGDFYGNWAPFSGTLNISSATGSEFRMAESYSPDGFPNALVHLGGPVTLKHVGILSSGAGTTISIGALSGISGSYLAGGVTGGRALTYRIGGKGVDALFSGNIFEQTSGSTLTNIIKTGSGIWTLAGNGSWGGGTGVEGGTLRVSGNIACAGATSVSSGAGIDLLNGSFSTDSVVVNHGATLSGYGTLVADLNGSGTIQTRGFSSGTAGVLAVQGSVFLDENSVCRMRGGVTSDLIQITGDLSLDGVIQISLAPGTTFGRYPIIHADGVITGNAMLTGIPVGTTAKLSTGAVGSVELVIDDSDEDGLPDSWEMSNFGNLAQTPDGDKDGDGSSNLVEYRLDLDPSSGSILFSATSSGQTLTWPSAQGIVFTVKRSLNLESGEWQTLGTVVGGTGATASYTDPSSFEKAFYRVEFVP